MIRRLILTDFMAHEHTELELGQGVTVLSGPNNSGKSAIVEALRCVATNPPNDCFIRHGAKEARVEVELDDGTRVIWGRKPRSAWYELYPAGADAEAEPVTFHKMGRGKVPEEIEECLRLSLVSLDDGGSAAVDVHLGNQREPVFLLGGKGSEIAAFFAASSESAHLLKMQELLANRRIIATRDRRAVVDHMDRLADRLDELASLPDVTRAMDAARATEARVAAAEASLPPLERTAASLADLRRKTQTQTHRVAALAALQPPPPLTPVDGLARWLDRNSRTAAALRSARTRVDALAPLMPPPALHPAAPLASLLARLNRLQASAAGQNARSKALESLEAPPALHNTPLLSQVLQKAVDIRGYIASKRQRILAIETMQAPPALPDLGKLQSLSDNISILRRRTARGGLFRDLFETLREPPILTDTGPLEQRLAGITGLRSRIDALRRELAAREKDLAERRQAIQKQLERIGQCPLCGHAFDTDSFLTENGHG